MAGRLSRLVGIGVLTVSAGAGALLTAPDGAAAQTSVPCTAAPTTLPAASRDVAFRTDFGLPTDATHIAAARSNPGRSLTRYGVALSPTELAEVDFESGPLEGAERDPALQAYLRAHGDNFAGLYLDHTRGGRTVIRFTSGVPARRAELTRVFRFPSRLIVETAPNSAAALEALEREIQGTLVGREIGGAQIAGVGIDVPHDVVTVTLTSCAPAALGALAHLGNASVLAVHGGAMPRVLGQQNYEDAPPYKGGQSIESYLVQLGWVYQCTSGFVVQQGSAPTTQYWVLSAGHCGGGWGATGSVWDQAGYFMGRMTNNNYHNNTSADASLISISATPSNEVFAQSCTCGFDFQFGINGQQAQDADNVGDTVCLSGSGVGSLGISCAQLQAKDLTETVLDPDVPGGQTTINWLRQTDISAHPGDSGGSIFNNYTGIALGTATAGNDSTLFYNHIFDDTNGFGVTVDTTAPPVG